MSNVATLAALDDELNQMVLQGKAMEAFEKFYDDDCHMQEGNDKPCEGKAANRKREEEFFSMVQEFHGAKVLASAVGDGVSFSEWMLDVTMKGAPRMQMYQVARRVWKNGKIVHERFYGAK